MLINRKRVNYRKTVSLRKTKIRISNLLRYTMTMILKKRSMRKI